MRVLGFLLLPLGDIASLVTSRENAARRNTAHN